MKTTLITIALVMLPGGLILAAAYNWWRLRKTKRCPDRSNRITRAQLHAIKEPIGITYNLKGKLKLSNRMRRLHLNNQ